MLAAGAMMSYTIKSSSQNGNVGMAYNPSDSK